MVESRNLATCPILVLYFSLQVQKTLKSVETRGLLGRVFQPEAVFVM